MTLINSFHRTQDAARVYEVMKNVIPVRVDLTDSNENKYAYQILGTHYEKK